MLTGVVFDIQPFAVHDGPGIRTQVFLKGCPLRCAWCCNPESHAAAPELRHRRARCHTCFQCAAACPSHAIQQGADGLPRIDRRACAQCATHACIDACPNDALAMCGTRMTPDEVVAAVLKDAAFYRNSGGGVTFSGGEPLAQPAFLEACLRGCREAGIATAVSTTGYTTPEVLDAIEPLVDLFLFDLKLADTAQHAVWTGVGNEPVFRSLATLASRCPEKLVLRLPLVPGATDAPQNLATLVDRLAELGLGAVQVAPYHGLGADKYADFGRAPPMSPPPPDAPAVRAATVALRRRIDAR